MPGYIMHMAEAKLILEKIGKGRSQQWKKAFVAGCLLPDTKKREKKVTSHFWHPDTLEDMAIPPDLKLFLDKYEPYLKDPVVLGYYAHLHLDERFVNVYWKEMARFYDDAQTEKTKKRDITKVQVRKTGEIVSREEFFSDAYYYGDYSKMNGYFIDRYDIHIEQAHTELAQCKIEEVVKEGLGQVILELEEITRTSRSKNTDNIQVFTKERLASFLERTAMEFIQEVTKWKDQ